MITPIILTYNEQCNIRRTLQRLTWAKDVVLVDSGSTDLTCEWASQFANVRVVRRPFDNHTAQWNFAVSQSNTLWVLSLDADYTLTPELENELREWKPDSLTVAWYARFRYCINGHPLRGTLYPPRAVLFRRDCCIYVPDGHTQLLNISGSSGFLRSPILHDDRKSLKRWLAAQSRYVECEVRKLDAESLKSLTFPDRVRGLILPAPLLVPLYLLFFRGLILDGWRGWFYALQRTYVELLLSLYLIESLLVGPRNDSEASQ